MTNQKSLRTHLVELLNSSDAHVDLDAATKSVPVAIRGTRPEGAAHSPWELLEHLRITQEDILAFSRHPGHTSPEFPAGYWPNSAAPPNARAWDTSVNALLKDRAALVALVEDEAIDLFAPIPHGAGQTLLREVLLAADHNAYHVGQLVQLRRRLGAWE